MSTERMTTRYSKKVDAEKLQSATEIENQATEDVLLESRLDHLTTVVKTLASTFSEVKKSTENAAASSSKKSKSREKISSSENSDLDIKINCLNSEVSLIKTELTEISSMLKMLMIEKNTEKSEPTEIKERSAVRDMTLSP